MAEYTCPGPWEARRGSGDSEHAFDIIAQGDIMVAKVSGRGFTERQANARLIAAAPELAAALEAAYAEFMEPLITNNERKRRVIAQAREVVAKVKGEA